jgi:hypothetical protein
VNLECGGYFWRIGGSDWVECVEILPDSDLNGADNVFHVIDGSIYIPDDPVKRKQALDCIGFEGDVSSADWSELVRAFHGYSGIDTDNITTVQIGPIDPLTNQISNYCVNAGSYLVQLRGNCKLKNYVKKNFLQ